MNGTKQLIAACTDWRRDLDNRPGDRAHLRRAGSIADAMMVPATHYLGYSVAKLGLNSMNRAALLASLLAQAKECEVIGETMPARLGQRKGDRATFSGNRFRRLLQSTDEDDLLRHLRRAVGILNGHVHVPSLVEAVRFWSFDPDKRTRIISSWASDYYGKAPVATSL